MISPFVRIALRWLGGYLVAKGIFAQTDSTLFNDPDLIAAANYGAAAACALLAEGWYILARKFGWEK